QPDPEEPGRGDGRDAQRAPHGPSAGPLRAHRPHAAGDPRAGMEVPLMRLEPLLPLWALIPLFGAMLALCIVLLVRRPRQRTAWGRRVLMVALLLAVALRPVTPIESEQTERDRKSTRLNSSHVSISYAVFCLTKKKIFILILRHSYL